MANRYRALLEAYADTISGGGPIMTEDFALDNNITMEEEEGLAEGIESGIRMLLMMADLDDEPQIVSPLQYID